MIRAHTWSGNLNLQAVERREHSRTPLAIQIELRPDVTNVPMRLQTSDISHGGCYVEMTLTLEVGTRLNIILWLEHTRLALRGVVVTRHPQFGNGIQFLGVSAQDRILLADFLDAHAGCDALGGYNENPVGTTNGRLHSKKPCK